MREEYNEFIGIYSNVYPQGFCQHLIENFERVIATGAGSDRYGTDKSPKHNKDDYQLNALPYNFGYFDNIKAQDLYFKGLQDCFDQYSLKFSILNQLDLNTINMKIQKTGPGQGYHLWHSEQGNSEEAKPRVLTFILYLNTLDKEDGGETEFFYQRKRYNPVENTLIIWPASFTHAHRGNAVLGINNKYIVTGWFILK